MSIEKYRFFDSYRAALGGNSDLSFRAARYMLRPFVDNVSEFGPYWEETKNMLKRIFQTENDIVAMCGSIRLAFDAIISNTVEPGDKVLALANGYWGKYVAEVVASYGGIPIVHEEAPSRALNPMKVKEEIEKQKDVKVVTVMHVETDTGIVHPVKEIGQVVRENSDALYVVDCATSLGAMEVKADEWGADFCFSGSHKAMSSPVGLAFITGNDKAWDTIKNRKTSITGIYNNLRFWKALLPEKGTPMLSNPPLPTSTIHAVRARLDYIFRYGKDKIYERHEIAAKALRYGLMDMGLDLLSESAEAPPCSNVVTVVKLPSSVDEKKLFRIVSEKYNICFASPGLRRSGVMRFGTINESQVSRMHILYALTALGLTLSELGVTVNLEEAIRKANEVLGECDSAAEEPSEQLEAL